MAGLLWAVRLSCCCTAVFGLRVTRQADQPNFRVVVQELLPLLQDAASLPSLSSLGFSIDEIYGQSVCPGSPGFISDAAQAPANFCRRVELDMKSKALARQAHQDWVFDNYALERIMLGKWLSSPRRCNAQDASGTCSDGRPADVVVVPSVSLHYFVKGGYAWRSFYQQTLTVHELYWQTLAAQYQGTQMPLLVVHFPFAYHCETSVLMLRALARMPTQFVRRVVIASLESNLFGQHRALPHTPVGTVLAARQSNSSEDAGMATPTLVTLPYPTSLLSAVNFTQSSTSYAAERARPIAVSLGASRKPGAWIRDALAFAMRGRSVLCSDAGGPDCARYGTNLWETAVNSVFCIQPPGDTLTRASFYVAVLSGCIPVVFDGGQASFDAAEKTSWAWRADVEPLLRGQDAYPFVDYREFAVVLNATDIRLGKVDVVSTLLNMPKADPQRLWALRQGLDRVAPLMRYAAKPCSGECRDAFSAFESVLQRLL